MFPRNTEKKFILYNVTAITFDSTLLKEKSTKTFIEIPFKT